jgi:hypothetical protein
LELLREGLEDFEKIHYLKKKLGNTTDKTERIYHQRLTELLRSFDLKSGQHMNTMESILKGRELLWEITSNSK